MVFLPIQFFREISQRFPYNQKGAVQTAIDDSLINLESPKKNISAALRSRFDSYDGNQNWLEIQTLILQKYLTGTSMRACQIYNPVVTYA